MRILVTGGAGFIGSAFVRQAIANGHRIINLDKLTYATNLDNLALVAGHDRYSFEQVDICDRDEVTTCFARYKPDAVAHFAAESHVDRSLDAPSAFIKTNIEGTGVLLQAAHRYWVDNDQSSTFWFLHISTDEVFGSLGKAGYFDESSAYAPNSPYAASKAASDHLVRAWRETYGLPILITNCSNNFGPYQFPEKLIPVVVQSALAGREIPLYGNGKQVRDWLHVADHIRANLLVLEHGALGETYVIGGHGEVTNLELVTRICNLLDEKRPKRRPYSDQINFVADRPGHDQRYAINSKKISSKLGWTPQYSLMAGLRHTISWYLKNQQWLAKLKGRDGVGERLGLSNHSGGLAA